MAITRVIWNRGGGHDIHVLAGKISRPLDSLLAIQSDGTTWTLGDAPPAGATVKFVGEFDGQPNAHGVHVHQTKGSVTVDDPRPVARIYNFLVRAEVYEGTTMFASTPRIRVHVHDRLVGQKVWLAPDHLTLRAGASVQYLTVLAQFDDGVIGNITYLPGLSWSRGALDRVHVHPSTGALRGDAAGDKATITVKLPHDWGDLTATAEVSTEVSWAALGAATKATLISGPGQGASAGARNLLILPEGFADAEKDTFRDRAQKALRALRTDLRASPFNLLGDVLNVWLTWIPSRQKGVTVAHELDIVTRSNRKLAGELPLASAPPPPPPAPAPAPALTDLGEILFEAGLPVLKDAIDADASDLALMPGYLLQGVGWRTFYGAKLDNRIDLYWYKQWANLADRRLANDRDTALGLAVGGAPNHEDAAVSRALGFHPLRANRTDLDAFLGALTDDKGFQIGALAWGTAGKDRLLVYTLASAVRDAGAESSDGIFASLNNDSEFPIVPVPGAPADGRAVNLPDPVLPRTPPIDTTTLLAHEASHALGLQDEYGYAGTVPANLLAWATGAPNTQDRDTLLAAPNPPHVPALDGGNLKWQWPRMRKVAITAGVATPVPPWTNKFVVPHQPFAAGAAGFVEGEIVQLRDRALVPRVRCSDTWRVAAGGVAPNALTIERSEPITATLNVPTFPGGSLLYAPHLDPAAVKPLTLVHDKVRDHITATGQPLNAPAGAAPNRDCSESGGAPDVQQPTNWPPGLTVPKGAFRAWVVGAHEGGAQYKCGVYHPAGACLMRADIYREFALVFHIKANTVESTYLKYAITLCAVCRYALVDLLDPTQHGRVDAWYDTRYPS